MIEYKIIRAAWEEFDDLNIILTRQSSEGWTPWHMEDYRFFRESWWKGWWFRLTWNFLHPIKYLVYLCFRLTPNKIRDTSIFLWRSVDCDNEVCFTKELPMNEDCEGNGHYICKYCTRREKADDKR